MFTGIVEEMGRVNAIDLSPDGVTLSIIGDTVLQGTQLGDSIAVNGVCLTVTQIDGNCFNTGLAPETLKRTNLGELNNGSNVRPCVLKA